MMRALCVFFIMLLSLHDAPANAQEAELPQKADATAVRDTSLFFPPTVFEKYMRVIDIYENGGDVAAEFTFDESMQDVFAENAEAELPPITFPHYQLYSIIYYTPTQWMVRLNGVTLTPETNNADNPLYVAGLDENRATFKWKPQDNRLLNALANGEEVDRTISPHRKHQMSDMIQIDPIAGVLTFTLEPNQFYYSKAMNVYEGDPADIIVAAPPPPQDAPTGEDAASNTAAAAPDEEARDGDDDFITRKVRRAREAQSIDDLMEYIEENKKAP